MEFNKIMIETEKNIEDNFLDTTPLKSVSDYESKIGEFVSGVVVKYINENGLLVDLKNGVKGLISVNDFEDMNKISNISLINKVGQVVFCEVTGVTDGYVVLNRRNIQKK